MDLSATSLPELHVLCTALEQFVENQPELETWETEAPEVGVARGLLDAAEAERLRRLELQEIS